MHDYTWYRLLCPLGIASHETRRRSRWLRSVKNTDSLSHGNASATGCFMLFPPPKQTADERSVARKRMKELGDAAAVYAAFDHIDLTCHETLDDEADASD